MKLMKPVKNTIFEGMTILTNQNVLEEIYRKPKILSIIADSAGGYKNTFSTVLDFSNDAKARSKTDIKKLEVWTRQYTSNSTFLDRQYETASKNLEDTTKVYGQVKVNRDANLHLYETTMDSKKKCIVSFTFLSFIVVNPKL